MSKVLITQRDVLLFEYLHACKVATTKQINREIFKTSHATCYQRLQKYVDKKCLKVVPTDRSRDQSFAYEITNKGEKIVRANFRDMISGNRLRSNSVAHDLTLVDIRNTLMSKQYVREYYTENQIQTYKDFRTDEQFQTFQELQLDAVMKIQKEGSPGIWLGIEYELSEKAICRYQEKIRRFYYKGPAFLIYICESKSLENKVKRVEREIIKERTPNVFYLTLEEFLGSTDSVTFTRQDDKVLHLV